MFTRKSTPAMVSGLSSRMAMKASQSVTFRIPRQASLTKCLRKTYSTFPPPPSQPSTEIPRPIDLRSQFAAPSQPQKIYFPREPRPKHSLRRYIYAAFFLLFGMAAGQYVRLIIAPPPLPAAGSKEDELMIEFLQKEGLKLPIVESLSADPNWEFHDAYTGMTEEEKSVRLTTGPLAGARAMGGFQRIFYNKTTGEGVAVVWFGGAVAGWPGVTHGGLVATILDEQLGRCAIRQFPSKTGVTANLEINYLKPVVTNSYYVIRTMPTKEGMTDRKMWVTGRLETLEGRVCSEGKALFVVPKNLKTKSLADSF